MNLGRPDPAADEGPRELDAEALPRDPAWSIRKLIELIDGAIDSAGAQLARSAGLWADSAPSFDDRDLPSVRRRPSSASARSLLEEADRDHGIVPGD